jgi:iron only hydrogenase large subunit-like protein
MVKNYFATEFSLQPSEIFHVTIMPCLDKKHEASKSKFFDENIHSYDVDLVLTTEDFLELLKHRKLEISTFERAQIQPLFTNYNSDAKKFYNGSLGPSDGFFEYLFKKSAQELFGVSVEKINYVTENNVKTAILQVEGKTVLKFGAVHGFRTVQQFARLIKLNKCDYHFLEMMACPGGCINGGGQLKESQQIVLTSDILNKVNAEYNCQEEKLNPEVEQVLDKWLNGNMDARRKYLHTNYGESAQTNYTKRGCKCTLAMQW